MGNISKVESDKRHIDLTNNILAGLDVKEAMLKAGFSQSMADHQGNATDKVKHTIEIAREEFNKTYTEECAKRGLTGDRIAQRIDSIISKSSDKHDFNAIGAIRLHMQYLTSKTNDYNASNSNQSNPIVIPVQINVQMFNEGSKVSRETMVVDDTQQQNMESKSE